MARTVAEIENELALWYKARERAAAGQSFTLTTSAGTRQLTSQDLTKINSMIAQLNRELDQKKKNLRSPFSFADFNNDLPR